MRAFTYERAIDAEQAVRAVARPGGRFIAGGTNLLDLMKVEAETPAHLVDVSRLPFMEIADTEEGGLRIGSAITNSDLGPSAPEDRRPASPAGNDAAERDQPGRRRADHRRGAAAATGRRPDLSQGSGPRVLCLRAGLGRGPGRCRG